MDLLVLSEVRWGYFRTRKQFLLSRFPERWRVFFAQPPAFGADDPWTPCREGRVTYFTVPFLKPGTSSGAYNAVVASPAGRSVVEWCAERWLRSRVRALGIEPHPVVMVSNIYCPGALRRLAPRLTVYDFNDHPLQFSASPPWAPPYWKATLPQADLVFAVSEHYRRMLAAETNRPVVLLGNGVEFEHFAAPRPVPGDLAGLPRPLIGYVGLLSHFLDFDTLEALRAARRGGTLVLIGPGSPATERAIAALAGREGVAVLGPRPYADIPDYMGALDVGVIPFSAQNPYVQGINPNKVYQYLAAGTPVVTTPLLDLEARFPLLEYAATPAAMADAVGRVLEARPARAEARALARGHDWGALAERMVSEIESRLGGRS